MIRILGIRVDEEDMLHCLRRIAAWLEEENRSPRQVVTLNPEGVWLARQDARLRQTVERAALVVADGNGLLWAAKRLGYHLPERVTGIDLMHGLAALAAERGWRLYLLGAAPGVAALAADKLRALYPGLIIVGAENGYFRDSEPETLARLRAAEADILFCALGMPYQELWLDEHAAELGCRLTIGLGGSFDVLAGKVKRAPEFWQKRKLEWLWRLVQDPRRWRRVLIIPRFIFAVYREQAAAKCRFGR